MTIAERGLRCLCVCLFALSCTARVGGAGDPSAGAQVQVRPLASWLAPGSSMRFYADVSGLGSGDVRWTVEESAGGSISDVGLYRAPQATGTFHVRAVSVADPTFSARASVTVTPSAAAAGSCIDAPLRSTGTIYYYCDCQSGASAGCTAGNDSNAGTSPDAPRRTLASARKQFNAMNGGDTVALCRGGAWTEAGFDFFNTRCTAAQTCDLRDYTPSWGAGAPRPLLQPGSTDLFTDIQQGHDEGYRFWNLDIRHSGGGTTFHFGSDLSDVDVCGVSATGGMLGVNTGPEHLYRITFRNSSWTRFTQDAMLTGTHDLVIDSNYFAENGYGSGMQSHTIYLGGGDSEDDGWWNEQITNNEIHVGDTHQCQSAQLVVHGRHSNVTIENNLILVSNANGACYGISAVNGGYPYAVWFRNLAVRRNRILQDGGEIAISATNCVDCSFTDNVISMGTSSGWHGIVVPESAARTSTYPDDARTTRAIIQNNSIYMYNPGGARGVEVRNFDGGSGYIVQNNAVWVASGGTAFMVAAPTSLDDHNLDLSARAPGDVWLDAPNGDFRPVNPGPLIGTGDATSYSSTAIGAAAWDAADAGVTRTPPTDVGALVH